MNFVTNGKSYHYLLHEYNCGIYPDTPRTERTVEVPIAVDWILNRPLSHCGLVEVGAVTGHYFPGLTKTVIDLYEQSPFVTYSICASSFCFLGWDVVSISTLEHIETTSQVDVLCKLWDECNSCLITIPMGMGNPIEKYILEHTSLLNVRMLNRDSTGREWSEVMCQKEKVQRYGSHKHYTAASVCVIRKTAR